MKPPSSGKAAASPSRIPVFRGIRKRVAPPRAATTLLQRMRLGQDAARNIPIAGVTAQEGKTDVKKALVEVNKAVSGSEPSSSTVEAVKTDAASSPKGAENQTPNVTVRKRARNFCDVATNVPITPRRTRSGALLSRRSIFKPLVPDAQMATEITTQDEINRTIDEIPNLSDIPEPQAILSFSNDASSTASPVVEPRLPEIRMSLTPPPATSEVAMDCDPVAQLVETQQPAEAMETQTAPSIIPLIQPIPAEPCHTEALKAFLGFNSSAPTTTAASGHAQVGGGSGTPTRKTTKKRTTKLTRSTSPVATRASTSKQPPPVGAAAAVVLPEAMVAKISALDLVSTDDNKLVVPEEEAVAAVPASDNVDVQVVTDAVEGESSVANVAAGNSDVAGSNSDAGANGDASKVTDNGVDEPTPTVAVGNSDVAVSNQDASKVTDNGATDFTPTVTAAETDVSSSTASDSVENADDAGPTAMDVDKVAVDATDESPVEPTATGTTEADASAELSIIITDEPDDLDDVEPLPEGDAELDAAKKDLNKKHKERRNSIFPRQAIQMLKNFREVDKELANEQPTSSNVTSESTEAPTNNDQLEDRDVSSPVPKKARKGKQIRGKKASAKATKKAAAPKAPQPPPAPEPIDDGFQPRFEVDGKIMVAIRVPKANKSGFKKIQPTVELNPLLLAEPTESCLRKPANQSWNGQKHFRWADDAEAKELAEVQEFDSDFGGMRKSTFQRSMFQLHRADEWEEE